MTFTVTFRSNRESLLGIAESIETNFQNNTVTITTAEQTHILKATDILHMTAESFAG